MDINNPFGVQFVQSDTSLNEIVSGNENSQKKSSSTIVENSKNKSQIIINKNGDSKITQDPNKTQIETTVRQKNSIGQTVGIVFLVIFILIVLGIGVFVFIKHRKRFSFEHL